MLQLNLSRLPEPLVGRFGEGLLQLFMCPDEHCHGVRAFKGSNVVRLIQPHGTASGTPPADSDPYPAKIITGWSQIEEYPHPEEAVHGGFWPLFESEYEFDEDESDEFDLSAECDDMHSELNLKYPCHEGDKLAGWPGWMNAPMYPDCPRCMQRMQFVVQIDTHNNLAHQFGDNGIGYVTQCPAHTDVLAFGSSCC